MVWGPVCDAPPLLRGFVSATIGLSVRHSTPCEAPQESQCVLLSTKGQFTLKTLSKAGITPTKLKDEEEVAVIGGLCDAWKAPKMARKTLPVGALIRRASVAFQFTRREVMADLLGATVIEPVRCELTSTSIRADWLQAWQRAAEDPDDQPLPRLPKLGVRRGKPRDHSHGFRDTRELHWE